MHSAIESTSCADTGPSANVIVSSSANIRERAHLSLKAARQIVDGLTRRKFKCILTRLARVAIATERIARVVVVEAIKVGHLKSRGEPGRRWLP